MGKDGSGKQVELTPQLTHISVWCGAYWLCLLDASCLMSRRVRCQAEFSHVYAIARNDVLLRLLAPGLSNALRQLIAGAPAGVKNSLSILATPYSSAPAVLEGWLPPEHQGMRQLMHQLTRLQQ